MTKIIDVEGIGPVYAEKLKAAGIITTEHLIDKGANPKGRKELGETTGISEHQILKWVNMVDLYRIHGVGSEYAELLEAAGVDTVVELSKRVPEHLFEKMEQVNSEKKLVRKTPAISQVKQWIEEAKTLPRAVSY